MPSYLDGGGSKAPTGKKAEPKKKDPAKQLATQLARLKELEDSRAIPKADAKALRKQIERAGGDLDAATRMRLGIKSDTPTAVDRVVGGGAHIAGGVLRQLARPGQAVTSAYGEWTRDSERKAGKDSILKLSLPEADTLTAAREGWNLKRRDTPTSILREAGDIRASKGGSTKTFGLFGDLRTNPLGAPKPLVGASNFAFDVAGAAALDPLTYVTLGTGAATKGAVRTAEKVIGAERAAVLTSKGMKGLTEAERALLAEQMAPKAFDALKGAQGGIKVAHPTIKANEAGRFTRPVFPKRLGLSAPQTVVSGETLGKVAGPLKPILGAVRGSKAVQTAEDIFKPRAAVARAFGDNAATALDDARVSYRGGLRSDYEDDINRIAAAVKRAGATDDDLRAVGRALDIGGTKASLPAHLHALYDDLDSLRADLTTSQADAGLLADAAVAKGDEYLPRVLTPEGREFLGTKEPELAHAAPTGPRLSNINDPHLRRRTLMPESPAATINETMAEKVGGDLFEENAARAFVARSHSARKAVATKHFIDDVAAITDEAGNPLMRRLEAPAVAARAPEGGARDLPAPPGAEVADDVLREVPEGWVEIKVPRVGTYAAPPELAEQVKKIAALEVNDHALKGVVEGLDRWMQLWKSYATVPVIFGLGFHERNAIGNVMNNYLVGLNPGDAVYFRAANLQRKVWRGRKAGDVTKFLSEDDRALIDLMRRNDVIGEGFFDIDLGEDLAARATPAIGTKAKLAKIHDAVKPFNPNNAVIASGRKLGSAIESNSRMALFIHQLEATGSPEEAARMVRMALFDYSDLTAVEQNVFKRIHAFYTFTRKNLPLQLGALMRTPGKFSRQQQVRTALAAQAESPEGPYPDYLDEQAGTPAPMGLSRLLAGIPKSGFNEDDQIVLAPDVPFLNAANTLEPLVNIASEVPGLGFLPEDDEGLKHAVANLLSNNLVGGAPGMLSTAAQVAGGEEFFSGREIRPGQRVEAPYYALPFAQDRVLNGENQPTVTTQSRFIAEQAFPLLPKVATFFPRGESDEAKSGRRRLSALTGVRATPLNEGTQRSELYRRLDLIERIISDLRARGYEIPEAPRERKATSGSYL